MPEIDGRLSERPDKPPLLGRRLARSQVGVVDRDEVRIKEVSAGRRIGSCLVVGY